MALNAGPSGGFWSRIGQNLPGALNMAGQMMPGPFGDASKITGALIKKPKQDAQPPQNGPEGMRPQGPQTPYAQGGIVRGPSMPMPRMGGMPQMGGGGMPPGGMRFDPTMRNGNTGITGGMFPGGMGGGGMNIQPQPMDQGMQGNLWNMYNQLSQGTPQRQLFY